jgi:hypothetical protein
MMPAEIAGILTTAITSWWDDVNESTQWQDGIFFALCCAYALVSAVALVWLSNFFVIHEIFCLGVKLVF